MVGGGDPFYVNFFCQTAPFGVKLPIFNRYSPVTPQPPHLTKKGQLTLIRALQ